MLLKARFWGSALMGLRLQGVWLRVWGLGFKVSVVEFGVEGVGGNWVFFKMRYFRDPRYMEGGLPRNLHYDKKENLTPY